MSENNPFRRALVLNLEASRPRQRQLIDYLSNVNDAVDRARVNRGLQPQLRRNGIYGPLLRSFQRWKLAGGRHDTRTRHRQYEELQRLILLYINTLLNHPLPEQQRAVFDNAIKSLILRHSKILEKCLHVDEQTPNTIPEGFMDSLYSILEIHIDTEPPPAVPEPEQQEEAQQQQPREIHNTYFRALERFGTPRSLVYDLTPVELHRQLDRRPELIDPLYIYYINSIGADPEFWQVERTQRDDPHIFYREVMYRLINSMRTVELHARDYYITIETDRESKSYHVIPERVPALISTLARHLENNGVIAVTRRQNSDDEEVVAEGISGAKYVRFGPIDSIYRIDGEGGITPPVASLARRSAKHPIYNLNNKENPFGSVRNVFRLRNNRQIEEYIERLGRIRNRTLMHDNIYNHTPGFVTDINQRETQPIFPILDIRGQRRRYRPRQGNFFPYFNLTRYDLHRYQIIETPGQLESPIFDDCCLIYALRLSHILSDTELTEMDTNIITRQLRPAKMVSYLNSHDLQIVLKTVREDWLEARINDITPLPKNRFVTTKYGVGTRILNLFLLCGHFMIEEETPVKRFAFDHREEIYNRFTSLNDVSRTKRSPEGTLYCNNDSITEIGSNGWPRRRKSQRGMMSSELIIELYIQYKKGHSGVFKPMKFDDLSCLKSPVYKEIRKKRRNEEIFDRLLSEPIEKIQADEYKTLQFNNDSIKKLVPPAEKLKKIGSQKVKFEDLAKIRVFYADFETCTSDDEGVFLDRHVPFMCCVRESSDEGHDEKATFTGPECGRQLLEWVLAHCTEAGVLPIVYFHNLSYDINFLMKYGITAAVNRNSLILQADLEYNGQKIRLKDSYGLLSMPLRSMARCFRIEIEKEIFPYSYYSPRRVASNVGDVFEVQEIERSWTRDEFEQFLSNLERLGDCPRQNPEFDLIRYAQFYCERDVDVLQRCIDIFHDQVLSSFEIDCHRVISISSIADKYLRKTVYYPFGQMYLYANHIRDFLLDAVHGGRVMCARNERHHFVAKDREHGLWDLDAVSLYPSAMSCLYTVGGTPAPLDLGELNYEYLENSELITAYVVEIFITVINKPRDFPLVIQKDPRTGKITYTNTPPVRMTVCDIELKDLVEFQEIEFHIIRGLKWTGPRDYKIQQVVRDLFEKRAEYKKAKNPLENSYKLLLNSIYGKTIQKAIDHEYKYYNPKTPSEFSEFHTWLTNHSNFIENVTQLKDSDIIRTKEVKPINKHFNNTLLGVQILAMSKHLMNRVMCLADDFHLDVYYQDTDSMHIRRDHVPLLERAYAERYRCNLRGSDLCQFHPDFDPICADSIPEEVTAVESYFLGKKCYIDRLVDQRGNTGFHIRMKGVSEKSIKFAANGDLLGLYKRMYDGETLIFDLCCDGQVKFDNLKDGTVRTKCSFERAVKATAGPEYVPFEERWENDLMFDEMIENILNLQPSESTESMSFIVNSE